MQEAYEAVRQDPWFSQASPGGDGRPAPKPVKLMSTSDLPQLARSLPRPMVFTNGVFDVLHRGHVMCLAEARTFGRSLVVGLNGDRSAGRLGKGPGRPVNAAIDRAWVLDALAAVDAIVVFDDDKPLAMLEALRPDVYVKGGDYQVATLEEAALVARWGGTTRIVDRLPGYSSTAMIDRMPRAAAAAPAPGVAQ